MARSPRCALDTPSDRQRLLLECVQTPAARNSGCFRASQRYALHPGDRHAGDIGGRFWHGGRTPRPTLGDVRSDLVLLWWIVGRRRWGGDRPDVADHPRLRGNWRYRSRNRLHLTGFHADEVVSGPAGHGHGLRHHGVWRRRAHRLPVVVAVDEMVWYGPSRAGSDLLGDGCGVCGLYEHGNPVGASPTAGMGA